MFAVDRQKHLIQVPLVIGPRALAAELIGIPLPKLPAPSTHGFVRQDDAALGCSGLHSLSARLAIEHPCWSTIIDSILCLRPTFIAPKPT